MDEFVADFVGRDRALKALALRTLGELELATPDGADGLPRLPADTNLRDALAAARSPSAGTRCSSSAPTARRSASRRARTCSDDRPPRRRRRPGDPELRARAARACKHNGWFCTGWVHEHWGDTLQPALIQHIKLTVIAVGIGFVIAFLLALVGFRWRVSPRADRSVLGLPLHAAEHRALRAARADHRARRDHDRDPARRVHAVRPLPQHRRGAATACRRRCSSRRGAWG